MNSSCKVHEFFCLDSPVKLCLYTLDFELLVVDGVYFTSICKIDGNCPRTLICLLFIEIH